MTVALLMLSCMPAQLSQVWKDPTYSEGPMSSLFVVAFKKNETNRRIWEDGFVAELAKRGVSAVPSYRLFPDKLPDTGRVIQAVLDQGYDGILIVRRYGMDTTIAHVPGYVTVEPVLKYDSWKQEFYSDYIRTYHHGYWDTMKTVRHEVRIWTTAEGGRLIWAGIGSVMDPSSSATTNSAIVKTIIPELIRQGIVAGQK